MQNENQGASPANEDVVVIDQFDAEGLKKNLETTLAQKKHYREKLATRDAEYAALKAEYEKIKPSTIKPEEQRVEPKPATPDFDSLYDNFEVIKALESDEMSELRGTAKELGVDPVKYIKSKAGQAHLKEFRNTKKSSDGTPNPSNRVPVFNGKSVDDVIRDDKASPSDKQKAFELKLGAQKGLNQSI